MPPFKEPMSQGLQKTAEECVEACPTGALSFFASGGQGEKSEAGKLGR
jgi:Fe-S-cluster-containing dehydrogenase component